MIANSDRGHVEMEQSLRTQQCSYNYADSYTSKIEGQCFKDKYSACLRGNIRGAHLFELSRNAPQGGYIE